jgi:hypothetical protein
VTIPYMHSSLLPPLYSHSPHPFFTRSFKQWFVGSIMLFSYAYMQHTSIPLNPRPTPPVSFPFFPLPQISPDIHSYPIIILGLSSTLAF